MDPRVVVGELDWLSQEILRVLIENGGEANTTELRTLTGVDDNNKINYRKNAHLVPRELIEVTHQEANGNKLLPSVASLTPRGEAVAESIVEHRDETTAIGDAVEAFDARLTRLEAKVDRIDTDTHSDGPSPSELQNEINETNENLQTLYQNMKFFRDYLNERDDGGFSEYTKQQKS